jgi:hypothetical protein
MATIIENNDTNPNRPVLISQDSGAGWAVAILIIVVVLVAGAFWYMRYYRAPATNTGTPGATVQVNLPSSGYAPTNNSTGASGGASGGTAPATSPNTQ